MCPFKERLWADRSIQAGGVSEFPRPSNLRAGAQLDSRFPQFQSEFCNLKFQRKSVRRPEHEADRSLEWIEELSVAW